MPFPVLQGEGVEYLGHADEAVIAISNYRLHIKFKDSVINVSTSHNNKHRDFFKKLLRRLNGAVSKVVAALIRLQCAVADFPVPP